jgi:hypothetical protein
MSKPNTVNNSSGTAILMGTVVRSLVSFPASNSKLETRNSKKVFIILSGVPLLACTVLCFQVYYKKRESNLHDKTDKVTPDLASYWLF